MSTAKKEPGLAMLVIVLALICLVVAALLGLVNQVTAPAIAANTEKTIQDSLKVVLPADSYEKVENDFLRGSSESLSYPVARYHLGRKRRYIHLQLWRRRMKNCN